MNLLCFLVKTGISGDSGGVKGYRPGGKHSSWLRFDGVARVF